MGFELLLQRKLKLVLIGKMRNEVAEANFSSERRPVLTLTRFKEGFWKRF